MQNASYYLIFYLAVGNCCSFNISSRATQFTFQASSVSVTVISCYIAVIRFFKPKNRICTTLTTLSKLTDLKAKQNMKNVH